MNNIKTWMERMHEDSGHIVQGDAMAAEIADLRAALAAKPAVVPDHLLRNTISNAIYGYGAMLEDHNGIVDAIAKAITVATPSPAQATQKCVGCDDNPIVKNSPCAVCGKESAQAQPVADASRGQIAAKLAVLAGQIEVGAVPSHADADLVKTAAQIIVAQPPADAAPVEAKPVARLTYRDDPSEPFDIVIFDRARCVDGMPLYATHPSPAQGEALSKQVSDTVDAETFKITMGAIAAACQQGRAAGIEEAAKLWDGGSNTQAWIARAIRALATKPVKE
jgi:hypothetical protein